VYSESELYSSAAGSPSCIQKSESCAQNSAEERVTLEFGDRKENEYRSTGSGYYRPQHSIEAPDGVS